MFNLLVLSAVGDKSQYISQSGDRARGDKSMHNAKPVPPTNVEYLLGDACICLGAFTRFANQLQMDSRMKKHSWLDDPTPHDLIRSKVV